jgi:hypothetical protein
MKTLELRKRYLTWNETKNWVRNLLLVLILMVKCQVVKLVKLPSSEALEETVCVCVQMKAAAVKQSWCPWCRTAEWLVQHLKITNFSAASGWLWWFYRRSGISGKKLCWVLEICVSWRKCLTCNSQSQSHALHTSHVYLGKYKFSKSVRLKENIIWAVAHNDCQVFRCCRF